MIFLKGAHPSVVIVTMVYQKDAGMDSKVLPSTFWKKDNDDGSIIIIIIINKITFAQ